MVFVSKKKRRVGSVSSITVGGAYDEIKIEEENEKEKNVTVVKPKKTQPIDIPITDADRLKKLSRFINFKF